MELRPSTIVLGAGCTLDASAVTTKFILPTFTAAARPTAATAIKGMLIYNTDTNKLNICTGSAWQAVTSAT